MVNYRRAQTTLGAEYETQIGSVSLDRAVFRDGTDVASREVGLNVFSLVCGFAGNLFLLLNFTARVRYIIALPLSIIFWILASSIVRAALCGFEML